MTSNSPWFIEEQVRLSNPAPITALTVTINVARNPSGLSVERAVQHARRHGDAGREHGASQLTYTWTLARARRCPRARAACLLRR